MRMMYSGLDINGYPEFGTIVYTGSQIEEFFVGETQVFRQRLCIEVRQGVTPDSAALRPRRRRKAPYTTNKNTPNIRREDYMRSCRC